VREAIRRARGTGSLAPLPFRIVRGDGEVRHLHATTTIVAAGGSGGRRLVGVLQDVTDRRRAEREIAAHFAVSEALLEWETLERGGPRLLGNLAGAMDFEVGFLWVPLDDVLVARCTWRAPSVRASRFEAATGRARLRPGCDLPGRVWRAREPINLAFLPPAADLPRRDAALRAGLRGAMAFPAGTDAEVLAILEFYSREEAQATARLMRSLTAIGYELGQFLARRRGQLQPQPLTPRELEVLRMAAQGLSRRRIAEQLVVSETTIKTHFENVYAKFGVTDRASAVAKVLRLGLIE
jgi:DNA-binding NarL/FixJ family response regulator